MNKRLKQIAKISLVAGLVFAQQSCRENNDTTTPAQTVPVAPKSITAIASATPDLSSLVAALNKAGLANLLNDSGNYTVFAPSNDAFAAFLKANNFATLNDVPTDLLKQVLLNHVLAEKVTSGKLTTGYVKTQAKGAASATNNLSMDIDLTQGVKINGVATVSKADIEASNGVIHLVNTVIGLPTVVTHATANPNFTNLVAALTRKDMPDFVSILSGTANSPFTVFAPTNDAFGAFLAEFKFANLAAVPATALEKVLKYHVVAKANVLAADLKNDMAVVTFLGENFKVMLNPAKIVDSNARESKIIATDVQCSNGVIHVLDKVIAPKL